MSKNLTPEQMRRRRGAAYELRQRARQLLGDAQMLDGWPALHLAVPDLARVAQALGISAERLTQAVESLCPDRDTTEADDDLAGTADTPERPE